LRQRQALHAGLEVPQSDVDCRNCHRSNAIAKPMRVMEELGVDDLDFMGLPADDALQQYRIEQRLNGMAAAKVGSEGPAGSGLTGTVLNRHANKFELLVA